MRGLTITIIVVLVVAAVASFLIFSGGGGQQDISDNGAPETNNQEGTQADTGTDTGTGSQTEPQTYNVEIKGFAFSPPTLTINAGDTIIWTNKDNTPHTVTSDLGTELDSPYLSRDNAYSHTFTQAGTYKYHCRPHPYMKGTIVVE